MGDLYTRALYKISSQDPHLRHLYTRSPDIPGPPRSLHRSSLQDLFTRPLWEISLQELSARSLHKTSMRDLFTRALYKSSSQDPHMRHLYTRSPDTPGSPRSLHRSSLQDLFTRPLWEISMQELSTRSLHKTSMRDLYTRALYKISSQDPHMRDLYTRALYKISSQDPHMRHRNPIWDIYTRSPDIPGPLRSPHYKISSKDLDQDPTRRKYGEGCADEIKIGTALQRERSDTHKLRRGLHEPKQKMPQAERQRHSISKMSTALQPERSDKHKVPRGLHLQT